MFPKAVFAPVGQVSGPSDITGLSADRDVFVFDIDALVPSTFGQMDPSFATYLSNFARIRPCYIVSNSGYSDVMARLPAHVRVACAGIFTQAGTELWGKYDVQIRHEHDFGDDLYEFVVKVIQTSRYPAKMAPMLESGSATLRLNIAGTRATSRQLKDYSAWEEEQQELADIMQEFRARFPAYEVYRDSPTSLLIMPRSFSTALVTRHILQRHKTGRVIGYVTQRFANTYGEPMCSSLSGHDILSEVGGPSDVSQLISYEMRQLAAVDQAVANAHPVLEGA